jgi:cytochrome b561
VNLHKSTGMLLGALILFRLYWRLTHRPPPLPASMPGWQRAASGWSHGLLYACMVLIPASGYIASNFSQWGVNFFNTVKLPPWGAENEGVYAFFNGMHGIATTLFVVLVALHVLAAAWHLIRKDGVAGRMWPGARGPQR